MVLGEQEILPPPPLSLPTLHPDSSESNIELAQGTISQLKSELEQSVASRGRSGICQKVLGFAVVATFRVARFTLQTRELWLVGGCRDGPSRGLPLTCPNVKNLKNFKKRKWKETQAKKNKEQGK